MEHGNRHYQTGIACHVVQKLKDSRKVAALGDLLGLLFDKQTEAVCQLYMLV